MLQVCIVSLLSLVVIIGVPGNVLIILVYAGKRKKSTAHMLILALAFTDLFVCFVLPVIIYDFLTGVNGSIEVCLVKHYASGLSVHLSFVLSGVIALDRFFVISQPHRHVLKVTHVKKVVFVCLLLSGIITIPTFVNTGMLKVQVSPEYTFTDCSSEPVT